MHLLYFSQLIDFEAVKTVKDEKEMYAQNMKENTSIDLLDYAFFFIIFPVKYVKYLK